MLFRSRCAYRRGYSSGAEAGDVRAAIPTAEQNAFRQAIIQRDMATRSTRASAEESANLEIDDARANFNDIFQMSQPTQQVAHSAPPPAAAAPSQPTVAAQPAAQTTGAAQPAAQPH